MIVARQDTVSAFGLITLILDVPPKQREISFPRALFVRCICLLTYRLYDRSDVKQRRWLEWGFVFCFSFSKVFYLGLIIMFSPAMTWNRPASNSCILCAVFKTSNLYNTENYEIVFRSVTAIFLFFCAAHVMISLHRLTLSIWYTYIRIL